MWPPLPSLLSRPLVRRDRRAAVNPVIAEIAVTVATVVVVGSAVIADISVTTAIAVIAVTVDVFAPAGRGRHERESWFVEDKP